MKILLVAGHGAGAPGACSGGMCEADLARELAAAVKERLAEAAELFDTEKNLYKFLKSGGNYDFSGYDYILELHFNSSTSCRDDGVTTGCELLLHTEATPVAADELMLKRLSELGFKNRGIKARGNLRNMNVMKSRGIAYALLEVCFIDDPDDMRLYQTGRAAEAIACAIAEGFGLSEKKELESVNDIVWELAERGIITDKDLWLKKLDEDKNAYWLARKAVGYIMGM